MLRLCFHIVLSICRLHPRCKAGSKISWLFVMLAVNLLKLLNLLKLKIMKLKILLRSDLCVIAVLTMLALVASVVFPYDIGHVECAWIGAALAAAMSVVGSIIGNASNNSTNNTNEEINDQNIQLAKETNAQNAALTRETNAQNYKIFQEQNAFNLDMWNKQNEYNSPAKEVQRLLAAGINPASKFGSTTPASSITSANAAPQVSPQMHSPVASLSMRPYDFAGMRDAGFNAVNAFNASQMANAETKNKNALTSGITLDNTLKSKGMADNLRLLQNMANEKGIVGDIAKRNLDFLNATFDLDMQLKYGDKLQQTKSIEMLEKQITWQQIQNDTASIVLAYQDQLSKAQIQSIWSGVNKCNAEINLIGQNALLTNETRLKMIEEKAGVILDNEMKGIDKSIKERTKSIVIQNAREDLYMKQDENRFYKPWNFYHNMIGRGAQFMPTPNANYSMQEYHFGRNGKRGVWQKRDAL